MSGLTEIAPLKASVKVQGTDVSVYGVSALGVAILFKRFPDLAGLLNGKPIEPASLFDYGAEAVAAIIAAGCGTPGDADAEAVASRLSISDQLALLVEIIELTLPGGLGPFVENLVRARGALGMEDAA